MNTYDLVIIGAGPAGLTLAQRSAQINKKVLIIDRENVIGGCHRVRRVQSKDEMLFTEHGPRVYSNSYVIFQQLLKEMGVNFYDLFAPYKFNITEIGQTTIFSVLTFNELMQLFVQLIVLIVNENHGSNTSLHDFIQHFQPDSIDIIDRICRLTDGGDSYKFTLNEFLQLFNKQFFYTLYQPKLPNDKGLFKIWKDYLTRLNTDFLLDADITDIQVIENTIRTITVNTLQGTTKIQGKQFVFAIPPLNLNELLVDYNLSHSWGDISSFSRNTAYIDYFSVTFHWNTRLPLKRIYGFPKSDWGIAFIVLSDYMHFDEKQSQTIISAAITISDKKSSRLNKTAQQATKEELVKEMYNVLMDAFGVLPTPTVTLISPGIVMSDLGIGYRSIDTAFISTSSERFLPFQNKIITNMYNVGCQNGKSEYNFTSLESAVSNAVALSKELYPELKRVKYPQTKITSFTDIIKFVLLIIILIYYGRQK